MESIHIRQWRTRQEYLNILHAVFHNLPFAHELLYSNGRMTHQIVLANGGKKLTFDSMLFSKCYKGL